MDRLPFEPSRASGAGPEPTPPRLRHLGEADVLTVSQLGGLIRRTLEQRIASPLRVIGEVSNLSDRGHLYFSLKDDESVVQCVAWASSARRFGFTPRDGDQVVATGHVGYWAPQGRTQLYVRALAAVGAGELERRFRAMCEELRGLGYFDEQRKRPLPLLPRRIAVITSAEGAALQDVLSTAAQRCTAVGLVVCNVRVQGEGAAGQVAAAIEWVDANRRQLGVDAVLVTRGGGSIEDLWAFNERVVADAAYACSLPLVAAIGHESDTTVIELVADRRASTPTQAAMHLVPDAAQLLGQVEHLGQRLRFLVRRQVDRRRERLQSVARHETFRHPTRILRRLDETLRHHERHLHRSVRSRIGAARVAVERLAGRLGGVHAARVVDRRARRLAVLEDRLRRSIRGRIRQRERVTGLHRQLLRSGRAAVAGRRDRLGQLEARLRAVDPRHVLRRGYSYTTRGDGRVVRSVADTRRGETLTTHVADGTIRSVVDGRPARRGRVTGSSDEVPQLDLFDGESP